MRCAWRPESAARGDGTWIVGIENARISVLAPPGVLPYEGEDGSSHAAFDGSGWQWAIWMREDAAHWPVIDRDTPDSVFEVDTPEVLQLVSEDLHDLVWTILHRQLEVARGFSSHEPDTVLSEDMARAGALAIAWLTDELIRGFPDRAHLLIPSLDAIAEIGVEAPDDAGELVEHSEEEPLLPLRCDAPLRDLILHWLRWRLQGRRGSRSVAPRGESWAGTQGEGSPDELRVGTVPTDLSGYGWDRETEPNAGVRDIGGVLS